MQALARHGLVVGWAISLAFALSGCRAVEVIFKAGVWTAVIVGLALMLLVYGAVRLLRGTTRRSV
jgi:uncharacterized membrane protein YjfL (UPF0719 family)